MLERLGINTLPINVDNRGRVSEGTLNTALEKIDKDAGVSLAAIMAVNNETGSVNDIKELAKIIRAKSKKPVHIHSDMVQALGKIPINLTEMDIDSASFSAHKLGGPRGIGVLYLRGKIDVLGRGGGQEGGIRSGTENVAGAKDFADFIEKYVEVRNFNTYYEKAQTLMNYLIDELSKIKRADILPECRLENENRKYFSPYILQAAFDNIPGEVMARILDDRGFAISTGSACHSKDESRPVLSAMGISKKLSLEGVRISIGYSTTKEEIDLLLKAINDILEIY
jgi:cysteine desulfurase